MQSIRANSYLFFDKKAVGSRARLQRRFGVKRNSYAGKTIKRIYHY